METPVLDSDGRNRFEALNTPLAAPQVLGNGRYELCELIGKGGMGLVYRARDLELDRSVAIKCLLDIGREGSRDLALREARTLASLSHPHIMRVFDILAQEDQVWIVGEWLAGSCVGALALPLPPATVLAVMAQVYDALAAAHSAKIIHRDIKPSNVMIGKDGRVTLIDFGVACATGSIPEDTVAGSLRYTDPRLLEGTPPDTLSDLFSAALFQVEIMTGKTVLPELAPLQLYRHIKRHLASHLENQLDGCYPPLATLVYGFTGSPRRSIHTADSPRTAREAAAFSVQVLRQLTDQTAESYLAEALARNSPFDAAADQIMEEQARSHILSPTLSSRQRSAWLAFLEASQEGPVKAYPPVPPRWVQSRRMLRALWSRPAMASLSAALGGLLLATTWLKRPSPPASEISRFELAQPYLTLFATPPAPSPSLNPRPISIETSLEAQVPVHLIADAWASVRIDGLPAGRLPQAAPFLLSPGSHTLELSNPVTSSLRTTIKVAAGKASRWHLHLRPKTAPRSIRLEHPGRLFIDGTDHGLVEVKTLPLTYGTHQIWVEHEGNFSAVRKVVLTPDSPKEIRLE